MKNLTHLTLLILGIFFLSACTQTPQEYGVIEGHVTIGPLIPVIREGEVAPTPAPEVYAAREIVIYEEDGTKEYTRLKIDANGNYRAELPVGIYLVDINHIGIDSSTDLPMKIEITTHTITTLNIDIDTGIR